MLSPGPAARRRGRPPAPRPGRRGRAVGRTATRQTARWARPADLGRLVVPGRRPAPPPGRLVLGRWAGGWWPPSGPSRSSCSAPPSPSKTSGFAVPAILELGGPGGGRQRQDRPARPHRRAPPSSLGTRPLLRPVRGRPAGPATVWSPARRRPHLARRPAGRGHADRGGPGAGGFHDRRRLLVRHGRPDARPPPVRRRHGRRRDGRRRPLGGDRRGGEVLDLLGAAGVPEAVDAARSAFAKEERQRSSIVTTVETLLEPFAGGRAVGGAPERRTRRPARRVRHPLPVRPGPRPAPTHPAVRRCAAVRARRRLRPGGPHRPAARPAAPGGARRGGQHRPACPTSTRWLPPRPAMGSSW